MSERHIYSSSRLGTDVTTHEFFTTTYTVSSEASRELGQKHYEISNYLGNVLSVITDQKLPVVDATLVVSYSAVVVTATDYSPFGVGLYGRSWSGEYRYGFNGKEQDNSTDFVIFESRCFHTKIARFLSVDPDAIKYPWQSSFVYHRNSPIWVLDYLGKGDAPVKPERGNVTVQKGDNLWNISKNMLGTEALNTAIIEKVQEIIEINGLSADGAIKPGQKLFTESESALSERNARYSQELRQYFETVPKPIPNPRLKNQLIDGRYLDSQKNFATSGSSYNMLLDASASGFEVFNIQGSMLSSLQNSINWFNEGDGEDFIDNIAGKLIAIGESFYFKEGLVRFGPENKIQAALVNSTYIMRNAYAKVWTSFNSNGGVTVEVSVYDTFDVTPDEKNKGTTYNRIAKPLSWLHRAAGANPNIQTRAKWSVNTH